MRGQRRGGSCGRREESRPPGEFLRVGQPPSGCEPRSTHCLPFERHDGILRTKGRARRGFRLLGKKRRDDLTHSQNGAPSGRHRAKLGRWRRLVLTIGSVFHSQRRQCRAGHHRYAEAIPIGGGITRAMCRDCGAVSLDLRETAETGESRLFKTQDELKTFAILRRQLFHHR